MMYLVIGHCGEYSAYTNWTVKVFRKKEDAEALRDRLNQWCKDNNCYFSQTIISHKVFFLKNPEDKQFKTTHTGTEYFMVEVESDE